jgi:hypothetical protein
MIVASFQTYVPLADLGKIALVCLAVAIIAPAAAALVITGFDVQARAQRSGGGRVGGDVRIGLGVAVLVVLIGLGLYALAYP